MTRVQSTPLCVGGLWTPWRPGDRSLYERFFTAWDQPGSYETNFAYVQQECRDQAWKFVDDDLLVTACARGQTSEFVFVLPPTGSVPYAVRILPQLCAQLVAGTGRRVILRKLSNDLHAALRVDAAFTTVPLETYRNPRELPEDIHPQVVAPVRRRDGFAGGDFVKMRNNLRTAHRLHHISFRNLDVDNRDDVIAMITTWAREHNERLHLSDSAGKAPICAQGVDPAAYTVFCESLAPLVDDNLYFGRVMMVDGQVGAFTFAGRTSRKSASLYASICRYRTRGASECMIVDMLDLLARKGIELLNFGGSEGLDLFRYKKKWGANALIATQELEYLQQPNPKPDLR